MHRIYQEREYVKTPPVLEYNKKRNMKNRNENGCILLILYALIAMSKKNKAKGINPTNPVVTNT